MDEKSLKNLAYIVAAIGLVMVGLFFIFTILKITISFVTFILPALVLGGAIYLGYRWLQNKNLEEDERTDSWP